MQVELINNQDNIELDIKLLQDAAGYILDKFDTDKNKSVNVVFVSDDDIRELNRKYRNIDRATDVLSFSYLNDSIAEGPGEDLPVIGEIYISPYTARRNLSDQPEEWDLELEIILLIIHGALHVYGYDHENDEERVVMDTAQDSLMGDVRNKVWKRY